jgi:hypothetical protein
MNYQTEAKPQCWRAVAVFDDRPEALLYLNRSSPQVRAGYREAYMELLDEEEKAHVVCNRSPLAFPGLTSNNNY